MSETTMSETPLARAIREEREAADALNESSQYDDAETEDYARETMDRARAATDEAVRQVEALVREVAAAGVEHDDPRIGYVTVQAPRSLWDEIRQATPAPTAQGDTTGGEGDE